ncbi:MAG: hypothetical protein VB957_09610 [Pseudomonadales bacterium]
MNLERAALISEVLGGVAIVVSVIYLAMQITDNNRLLRSQAHYNALEVGQRSFEFLIESDTLSSLLQQCRTSPNEVDDAIWSRCTTYYFLQANGWEYIYYQHLDNALPPEFWVGADGYFSNEAQTNAGWVRFWEETAIAFGEPFRSHLEQHVMQNPAFSGVENERKIGVPLRTD